MLGKLLSSLFAEMLQRLELMRVMLQAHRMVLPEMRMPSAFSAKTE